MMQENKELLLKDISGRLSYCPIVQITLFRNGGIRTDVELDAHVTENIWEMIDKYHALPYLRPMSSMTEEERKEYYETMDKYTHRLYPNSADFIEHTEYSWTTDTFDFLNAHHFDYRGLIPMGLANEAPEGMYNIN